jgi:hypothetical protein
MSLGSEPHLLLATAKINTALLFMRKLQYACYPAQVGDTTIPCCVVTPRRHPQIRAGMYERHSAPKVPGAKADIQSRYDDTAKPRYAMRRVLQCGEKCQRTEGLLVIA